MITTYNIVFYSQHRFKTDTNTILSNFLFGVVNGLLRYCLMMLVQYEAYFLHPPPNAALKYFYKICIFVDVKHQVFCEILCLFDPLLYRY